MVYVGDLVTAVTYSIHFEPYSTFINRHHHCSFTGMQVQMWFPSEESSGDDGVEELAEMT